MRLRAYVSNRAEYATFFFQFRAKPRDLSIINANEERLRTGHADFVIKQRQRRELILFSVSANRVTIFIFRQGFQFFFFFLMLHLR